MSYEPTQWKAGDTVTSAKLNKMEQGITNANGANILVVHIIANEDRLDKTAREILDADVTFVRVEAEDTILYGQIISIIYDEKYSFIIYLDSDEYEFQAETEDDYPHIKVQKIN